MFGTRKPTACEAHPLLGEPKRQFRRASDNWTALWATNKTDLSQLPVFPLVEPADPSSEEITDAVAAAPSFPGAPKVVELKLEEGEGDTALFVSQTLILSPLKASMAFFSLSIIMFMVIVDGTIVATSNTATSRDLKGGNLTVWIGSAYLLASTATIPIFARLSDIFGRKLLLLIFLAWFFVASIGASFAKTMPQLIAFRALQGIGGGGLEIVCRILPADLVTLRQRGTYQSIFEVFAILANGLGPVMGGAFAEVNWRLCYIIMLPLSVISFVLCIFTIPKIPMKGSWREKTQQIDFTGSVLVASSTAVLLLGLNWGGVVYAWASARVLAPICVAGVGYIVFATWETKGALIPIIPSTLFKVPTVTSLCISGFAAAGFSFFIGLFYIPQYLMVCKGYSALKSGTFLLIFLAPITIVVFFSGLVVSWTGKYRALIIGGLSVYTIGMGLFSTLNRNTSPAVIGTFLGLTGGALGAQIQTSLLAVQAAVPASEVAVVSGARAFLRNLGSVVGVAVGGAVINNAVAGVGLSAELTREIVNSPELIHGSSTLGEAVVEQLLSAYEHAFRVLFLICVGVVCAPTIAVAFLVKAVNLDDKQAEVEGKK
ncbi:MFS general substrate transporter [Meredithblackwellia eburnea MCA 4105]